MSKFTPGKWKIGYGGMEGDDYAVITSSHSTRSICNLEPQDYVYGNARLIAAAPEMYEALKYATRELEASGLCCDHPTIVKLTALLARIDGKEVSNG